MAHDSRRRFRFYGTLLTAALLMSVLVLPFPTAAAEGRYRTDIAPDRITYKPLRFQPPQAERMMLENGVTLYVLEDRELPLINLSLVVRTGSMYDPERKEGLAELTATVMRTGGTKKMSGRDVDNIL
jgi:zinc protease